MAGPGIAISEHFGYLIEPGLREVFWEEYARVPSVIPQLFNVQTSGSAHEYDLGVGSMGDFPEFEAKLQYDSPEQLWRVTYTPAEFAKGFMVERKLYDDNMYNVMNDRAAMLALSAWRTRETKAASVFNLATSTTGYDGKALGVVDHLTSPTDSTAMINLFTLALSTANMSTVRLAMRAWTDDRGNLANVSPDLLLVPPELEEEAWKIIQSPSIYESGSANLTGQFHRNRYRVIVWDVLTDSNRWFLIDSGLMKRFLKWYDRKPLEFGMENDFDTFAAKFRGYMRFGYGWSDWRWVAVCEPS